MVEDARQGLIKGVKPGLVSYVKAVKVKKMMDNSQVSDYLLNKALKGELSWGDVLPWRKLESQEKHEFISHAEGQKVEVTKTIVKPSDVARMIKDVDAEVKDYE